MSSPAETIAACVLDACDVNHSLPYRPARLDSKMAFVSPSDVWKEPDDRFCGFTIGLDVYLVASTAEQRDALDWLDAQTTILMELDPIDIGMETVWVTDVAAPFVFSTSDGSSFLSCRLQYSRFTNGDD